MIQAGGKPIVVVTGHAEEGDTRAEHGQPARRYGSSASHFTMELLSERLSSGLRPRSKTAHYEVDKEIAADQNVQGFGFDAHANGHSATRLARTRYIVTPKTSRPRPARI